MVSISIVLEEPAWPDVDLRKVVYLDSMIGVTGLENGMKSGKPSVAFRFDLPDGKIVIAETSMALFLTAADALKAKYGDPRS